MTFENILITSENGIGQITINRPSKLNALNVATIKELHDGLESLNNNPEIRVIILTGEGEKAFVAGADISEFAHFSIEEGAKLAGKLRLEGKDYIVQDGDVFHFRFNV